MPRIHRVAHIARKLASEHQLYRHARYAGLAVVDAGDRLRGRADPGIPPKRSRDLVGGGDFREVGQEFRGHIRELAGLEPSDRVLEVGSGIGRIALPLTEDLDERGTYDGLEIVKRGVRWCEANITSAHPNFRFHHADIENGTYNRRGRISAQAYRFPFEPATFDLVLLTSVFTHLLTPAVERYVSELERVVAPSGRVLATFYLLNEESERLLREGRSAIEFPSRVDGARVMDEHAPENAVAFAESDVVDLLARHGFDVLRPIHYGSWCGRATGRSHQDIVVAVCR